MSNDQDVVVYVLSLQKKFFNFFCVCVVELYFIYKKKRMIKNDVHGCC